MAIGDRNVWKFSIVIAYFLFTSPGGMAQQSIALKDGWEFLRQDLGGPWEAVRPVTKKDDPGAVPLWQPVKLPHCVNAEDAVDPDGNYYRGPAWYRTRLELHNPYPGGRTLLHFEGAGQKTAVYIYTTQVGAHTGGYDEWTVDITDAATAFAQTEVCPQQFKGKIPISIRTDNSRDFEMIPSGMSDFNLYGGIYRRLSLVYVPAIYIDQLLVNASVDSLGRAGKVQVRLLLNKPSNDAAVSFRLQDPAGHLVTEMSGVKGMALSDTLALPVRWGQEGQLRQVKVYSNCEEATLYLNGKSCGARRRNSRDYPAAGFRWNLPFQKGENSLRVVARKGGAVVEDTVHFQYLTEKWGKPARVKIEKIAEEKDIVTIRVRLLDEHGIPCPDATDWVSFGLAGDGRLIDNQGTSTGSRYVQCGSGQAMIRLHMNGGHSVVSAKVGNLPAVFLNL